MRQYRLLTAFPLVFAAALAQADHQIVLGKLGQALNPTVVYSTPSSHSRHLHNVKAYQYLVVKHSDNADWDAVYMKSGFYGYTPSSSITILPYTVYSKSRSRSSGRSYGPLVTSRSGNQLADDALMYIGTPYEWGGNDLQGGIDCSGFVQQLAGRIGVNLPRTAAEQSLVGTPIYRLEDLRAGDRLYFWEKSEHKIGHTGIYLGNGNFVHSSHGKGGVHTDKLTASWRKILVAARR